MYGIFINEDEYPFAHWIVQGDKTIETRTRNTLKRLLKKRVAIISTSRKHKPTIIGYATIYNWDRIPDFIWEEARKYTLIPKGSKYDTLVPIRSKYATITGKWGYILTNPEECDPYELPSNAIRHGRSYAEF